MSDREGTSSSRPYSGSRTRAIELQPSGQVSSRKWGKTWIARRGGGEAWARMALASAKAAGLRRPASLRRVYSLTTRTSVSVAAPLKLTLTTVCGLVDGLKELPALNQDSSAIEIS